MYLLAKEEGEGARVSHGCHVAGEADKAGLKASEWANAVAGAVGGKAGGKGPTSVGNGTNVEKVDEGVEIARKFLEKFSL